MASKTIKPKSKDKSEVPQLAAGLEEYAVISLDLIDDPEQPIRSDLTPASVEDLVMSIKQVGLIEPVVVKPSKGRYEVIAGHRRTYAARLAKLVEIPCRIRQATVEETEMLKIHENLYRADIKPADEAKHFSYLIDKQKLTPTKIAELISKSPSYVTDRLAILNYPPFLREAMDNGELTFSVAREFARFDDEKQMRTAVYYAKRGGMTQEMARKWVMDYKRSKESPTILPATQGGAGDDVQPVEHKTECVFCGKPVGLIEGHICYMHPRCHEEALKLKPAADEQPQPANPQTA